MTIGAEAGVVRRLEMSATHRAPGALCVVARHLGNNVFALGLRQFIVSKHAADGLKQNSNLSRRVSLLFPFAALIGAH